MYSQIIGNKNKYSINKMQEYYIKTYKDTSKPMSLCSVFWSWLPKAQCYELCIMH